MMQRKAATAPNARAPRAQKAPKGALKTRTKTSVGPIDSVFLLLVLILVAFGLVMVFSASYASANYRYGDSLHYIKRQAVFAVIGVVAMLIISRVPYYIYHRLAKPIYWICLGLITIVWPLNGFGAGRFISIGGQQFQPSELMKVAIIILFSALIVQNFRKMDTLKFGIMPFMLALLPVIIVLVALQHHLSATIIICTIGVAMMFVGGSRMRYFLPVAGAGVLGIIGMIMVKGVDYMGDRVYNWMHPMEDVLGDSWQTVQSLIAIGSGGFMGLGLGNSRQKYLYLPEPQNDFIFAIVCEELGFIGALLVILLFVFLVYRGFVIANKAPNKFASMVVIGITFQIALQALLNIAVVSNAMPNTGISLPFFSYGGTALMIQLAEMGIILNISRYSVEEKV